MTYPQTEQPGWGYPQHQAPKKKFGCMKIGLIVIGVLVLVLIIAAVAGGGGSDDSENASPTITNPEVPEAKGYRFEFTTSDGSGGDVTFTDGNFNTRQDSTAQSGWSAEIPGKNKWDVLGANLLVQNQGDGDITCRTFKGDELLLENTSTGLYSVVSCNIPN